MSVLLTSKTKSGDRWFDENEWKDVVCGAFCACTRVLLTIAGLKYGYWRLIPDNRVKKTQISKVPESSM